MRSALSGMEVFCSQGKLGKEPLTDIKCNKHSDFRDVSNVSFEKMCHIIDETHFAGVIL